MLVKYVALLFFLLPLSAAPLGAQAAVSEAVPVDFALVLDVSGSMDAPSCTSCRTNRLTDMVVAVERLVHNIHDLSRALPQQGTQHRISITVFGAESSGYRDAALVDVETHFSEIIQYLKGEVYQQVDRQGTSLGGGLYRALTALDKSSRPRNVILLTDGEQAQAPFIVKNADESYAIQTVKEEQMLSLDEKLGVNFYAIGIGLNPKMEKLLTGLSRALAPAQKAASRTPILIPVFANRNWLDLALNTQFQRSLSDLGSPQMVDYRWGTLPDSTVEEAFLLNKNIAEVTFHLLYDGEGDWNLTIKQEDQIYSPADSDGSWRYESGRGYRRFVMRPRFGAGATSDLSGTWTMQITGRAGAEYRVYAVVDDHLTGYHSGVNPNPAYAGDELTLSVDVANGGDPVAGATVKAYVAAPEESISSLLSQSEAEGDTDFRKIKFRNSGSNIARNRNFRYNQKGNYYEYFSRKIPGTETDNTLSELLRERNVSPLDEKVARLRLDVDLVNRLRINDQIITLEETTPGQYRGRYQTTETGAYTIVYRIAAQSESLGGDYHRLLMSTQTLGTAPPDETGSPMYVFPYHDPSIFYVRPVDSLGNYLGPGREDEILVVFPEDNGLAPTSHVQGDMRGGYLVQISGLPKRAHPDIQVRLAGHSTPLYRGSLKDVYQPLALLANMGIAVPTGDFAEQVDAGLLAEIGGLYQMSPALGLSMLLGYYGFNPNDHLGGVTGNFRYDLLANNSALSIITSVGGGYYFAKGGNNGLGLNANLGIERAVRPFLTSKLEVGFFNSTVLDATFLTISLGMERSM